MLRSALPSTRIMAVLKADAYGQGMQRVASYISPYVDYMGVAFAKEGVSLRRSIRRTPILVFVYSRDDVALAIKYHLCMSISSIRELIEADRIASHLEGVLHVHLAVNTGMNRYGLSSIDEFTSAVNYIRLSRSIRLDGVYSHLYDDDKTHNKNQLEIFDRYVSVARSLLDYSFLSHIEASHGILRGYKGYDMARAGISMYVADGNNLKDAVTLASRVQSIRYVKTNEFVGYSCHYRAKCDIMIGIVYGGYADGLDTRLSGMHVYIDDKEIPIIGDICMDVFFVDITGMDVHVGDEVTIIGGKNTIQSVASYIDSSPYELLSRIRGRVVRSYI